jgi:urease accessory protein
MRTLTNIIGYSTDREISGQLHDLSHAGRVEYLVLEREDTQRHRLRAVTDKGTDCAIALPRDQRLEDGSVLCLSDKSAIVVRMSEEHWLAVRPRDAACAVELGYFAGNLHWRVRFQGNVLEIAMEGPQGFYLERLQPFLDADKAEVVSDE